MEINNPNCYGCGKLLTGGEEKKRARARASLHTHLQTLSSLAAELGSVHGHEVDIEMLHTGYICRSCLRLVEKYIKLQKQLSNNMTGAFLVLPKVAVATDMGIQPRVSPMKTSSPSSTMEASSQPRLFS